MAKGKLSFEVDRCKGCELCTTVCPVNILEMDKTTVNKKGYHPATVTDMDKCVACTNCALICPDVIIKVEKVS